MKPLSVVFFIVLLIFLGCRKQEGVSDSMDCVIEGELLVWESEKKVSFDPGKPPVIILEEQRYYKPWSSYRVPLASTAVDSEGRFRMEYKLEKDAEYFLNVAGFHPEKYWNKSQPQLQYSKTQKMDYRLVAVSWAIPRFINQTDLPGDTFLYKHGIGGTDWPSPFVGYIDTIMPWIYKTWGGSQIDKTRHWVNAILTRNGITRDTTIYYFVPPGDTSIVEIRY